MKGSNDGPAKLHFLFNRRIAFGYDAFSSNRASPPAAHDSIHGCSWPFLEKAIQNLEACDSLARSCSLWSRLGEASLLLLLRHVAARVGGGKPGGDAV